MHIYRRLKWEKQRGFFIFYLQYYQFIKSVIPKIAAKKITAQISPLIRKKTDPPTRRPLIIFFPDVFLSFFSTLFSSTFVIASPHRISRFIPYLISRTNSFFLLEILIRKIKFISILLTKFYFITKKFKPLYN